MHWRFCEKNQFDQTTLVLIIHSYHKTIWHLVFFQQPNMRRQNQRFLKAIVCFKFLHLLQEDIRAHLVNEENLQRQHSPHHFLLSSYQSLTSASFYTNCLLLLSFLLFLSPCPSFHRQVSFFRWSSPQTPEWVQCKSGAGRNGLNFRECQINNFPPTSISFSSLSRTISFSNLGKSDSK